MTAPVPPEYAQQYDSQTLSNYGLHQVATGPYMIKDNASGNINGVGYQPGKLIDLVRNPNWNAKHELAARPRRPDPLQGGLPGPDRDDAADPLSGSADVNGDTPPPPAELRSITANSTQKKQLFFTPDGRQPLHRAEHAQGAVRQARRPQGGCLRPRPERHAPDTRRADRRPRSPRTSSTRASGTRASRSPAATRSTRSRAKASPATSRRRSRYMQGAATRTACTPGRS